MLSFLATVLLGVLPIAVDDNDGDLKGSVTITLGMEAGVRGTEVELGEIAQIVGDDLAVVARVEAVELGYAPSPGYSRVFRVDQIERTLARALPGVAPRFLGQRAIRVHPEVEHIPGHRILQEAEVHLRRQLLGKEVTFRSVMEVAAVEVPAGSSDHVIRARLDTIPEHSKTISIPVEIHVDGARYRTVWTSWEVDVWETRQVLAKDVRAGQILTADMFERRRTKRSLGEPEGVDMRLLRGSVALRDMTPGVIVTALDVQRPTVVAAGQGIHLKVRKGAIEARVQAHALQSGAIGDRIEVVTSEGEQKLVATIESRDTCSIVL